MVPLIFMILLHISVKNIKSPLFMTNIENPVVKIADADLKKRERETSLYFNIYLADALGKA